MHVSIMQLMIANENFTIFIYYFYLFLFISMKIISNHSKTLRIFIFETY